MTQRLLSLFFMLAVLTNSSISATFVVPDDQPSIQAAIDAAVTGDSILIRPGIYYENLFIEYKGLFLSAYDGFSTSDVLYQTIIDGRKLDNTVHIRYCQDTITLRGLTLCNGYGEHAGGIHCGESVMKLEHVLIRDNSSWMSHPHGGGGITAYNGSHVIMRHVVITGNRAYDFGGGIKMRYDVVLEGEDVTISGNICGDGGHSKGGGLYADFNSHVYLYRSVIKDNRAAIWGGGIGLGGNGASTATLVNVTLTGNYAGFGGGAIYACYEDNRVFLGNCILANNSASLGMSPQDQEVYFDDEGWNNELAFCYTDILGGMGNMYVPNGSSAMQLEGNANALPYFHKDLTLLEFSPCIDAGTDYYEYWGEVLIDIPPDQYYGAAPDMGAYENWDVILREPELTSKGEDWVKIYPNPVTQSLHVEITDPGSKKVELSLFDEKGALCLQDDFSVSKRDKSILTLSLSSFSPGHYTLIIHSQTRHSTTKLVIF